MANAFKPNCRSILIGSLPVKTHQEAIILVKEYNPEIPVWVQLPTHPVEGMIPQFLPGMPGLSQQDDRSYILTKGDAFDADLVDFYEEYLGVLENRIDMENSRFVLTRDVAEGFFTLLENLRNLSEPLVAVKGQVTGPITFATGVKDENKRAIFYHEQLRDAAVKLLSLKAAWQVKHFLPLNVPVIIFIDEPALAGFGSSEFTSISKEQVSQCLEEVIGGIHETGGLAGIHVCANTDWSVIFDTSVDIVNFDAYSYFDRFILYPELIKGFLIEGGILAWGIVPTSNEEDILKETAESLVEKWERQVDALEKLGIDRSLIFSQSLISPSCGTGSLSEHGAKKVLELNRSVSDIIRQKNRN